MSLVAVAVGLLLLLGGATFLLLFFKPPKRQDRYRALPRYTFDPTARAAMDSRRREGYDQSTNSEGDDD